MKGSGTDTSEASKGLVPPPDTKAAEPPAHDGHSDVHSESGALRGEHPGRARNPVVKVAGLAWLEFEKPDLARAEPFLVDFGFTVVDRTPETLLLRGRWAGTAGLVVRQGVSSRFIGPTFTADARTDLDR